ncbi:MAG: acetoin utilization protein AcuC [Chloroflexota bacterium]|nr:acetoin utilization protein AcuC [Chloroflexota bacterium]
MTAADHREDGAARTLGAGQDAEPLVVYGPLSDRYDFGPQHPLTPRRFGPGIDLLRATGATRFLDPQPATDGQLVRLHDARYIETVKAFSQGQDRRPAAGIGPGDCPPFPDMHAVSAAVAGGSITAMDLILSTDETHVFQPGGGLHHAMTDRASGFCIYNDVALAVAQARDAGHRVLYVDLDVHHGDGVQALFWDDPQVLTFSMHETGEALFPGTGFESETGGRGAPGSAVNVPLEPFSGDPSWLPAFEMVVPALAEAFRPTVLVSQHGCDSHAYDPLAHLRLTTRAYAQATSALDRIAHEHCQGRWFATGGGGYDAYRVVPRSWSLVWLAQAHREVPAETPAAWQERWETEAADFDQAPPPQAYLDLPDLVQPEPEAMITVNMRTAERSLDRSLRLQGGAR